MIWWILYSIIGFAVFLWNSCQPWAKSYTNGQKLLVIFLCGPIPWTILVFVNLWALAGKVK